MCRLCLYPNYERLAKSEGTGFSNAGEFIVDHKVAILESSTIMQQIIYLVQVGTQTNQEFHELL